MNAYAAATHPVPFGTLALPPLDPACRLSVTIPAKDEEAFIGATLDALRRQTDGNGQPLDPATYEVILLANNCADDTAGTVRRYARRYPTMRLHLAERTFPREIACVGTARRLMMDSAAARYVDARKPHAVVSTTDADTRVHHEWVFRTLESIDQGARAVGGRILVPTGDRSAASDYRKYHLQDVGYRYLQSCLEAMIDPEPANPWPRHFQNFGPSTAATVEAYLLCGGMPPRKSLEDVNFVLALNRADIVVTHNPLVRVYTSSRVSHRVDGTAFSHQLDEWADMSQRRQHRLVVSAANCRRFYKWKAALRRAYRHGCPPHCPNLRDLATALDISWTELRRQIARAPNFGSLVVDVHRELIEGNRFKDTPIEVAIRELRLLTCSLRVGGVVG